MKARLLHTIEHLERDKASLILNEVINILLMLDRDMLWGYLILFYICNPVMWKRNYNSLNKGTWFLILFILEMTLFSCKMRESFIRLTNGLFHWRKEKSFFIYVCWLWANTILLDHESWSKLTLWGNLVRASTTLFSIQAVFSQNQNLEAWKLGQPTLVFCTH